jgi:hypothetical protein
MNAMSSKPSESEPSGGIIKPIPPLSSTQGTLNWIAGRAAGTGNAVQAFAAKVPKPSPGAINASTCVFCGGKNCKYCGTPEIWEKTGQNAIPGLYSAWVTENVLAMQRPSTVLMQKHNLIPAFGEAGIRSIVNLQQLHEHPTCGFGIIPATGFSYDPEEWMRHGCTRFQNAFD